MGGLFQTLQLFENLCLFETNGWMCDSRFNYPLKVLHLFMSLLDDMIKMTVYRPGRIPTKGLKQACQYWDKWQNLYLVEHVQDRGASVWLKTVMWKRKLIALLLPSNAGDISSCLGCSLEIKKSVHTLNIYTEIGVILSYSVYSDLTACKEQSDAGWPVWKTLIDAID